jgi:hypothetical protein
LLKETVAVPMKQRHQANVIRPRYPVWIVDYGNEVEKNLMENWMRSVVGTNGGDDRIHVDAKTGEVHHGLHSFDASDRGPSFGLVMFSVVASTSLESSHSTRTLFLCGRKADGSTELALSSRLVTFLVAKFPWSIWDARIFDMTRIKI